MKRRAAFSLLLLGGCTSAVLEEDTASTTSTSSSTEPAALDTSSGGTEDPGGTSTSTTTTGPGSSDSTGPAWETEGADEGYATTGNCGFTCPPPPGPGSGGNGLECSVTEQDCPEGEKCNPWANDGGALWTATRCVPLDPAPAGLDELCSVEGAFVSGIDSCEAGLVCASSSPDSLRTNEGVCVALCGAAPCSQGTLCTVAGPLNLGTCGTICDPLTEGVCPPGNSCMPAGLGFACNLTAESVNDAPCNVPGQCDVGHVCIDASQCDAELSETCCAELCDLEAPSCLGGQTCTSYGSPLAAYSAVGFCED